MREGRGKIVGYTAGVYDMFHIGHLNVLERAKQHCDHLIVGVNSDEAAYGYKNKYPIIPESERMEIVKAIKYVDEVVRVENTDKKFAYEIYHYDIIFVGDDHKDEPKWIELDEYLKGCGSRVCYISYTKHVSSSKLSAVIDRMLISNE
ncbi:MAG: adenylyltransferase/cytidyltransferase family protein [Clostridiales bacterium]|nr:adenylyltransferase/cytidyltransferase family protein [Clostridiales bacterium]